MHAELIKHRLQSWQWQPTLQCAVHDFADRDYRTGAFRRLDGAGHVIPSMPLINTGLCWCLDAQDLHIENIGLKDDEKGFMSGSFHPSWLNTNYERDNIPMVLSLRVYGYLLDYWSFQGYARITSPVVQIYYSDVEPGGHKVPAEFRGGNEGLFGYFLPYCDAPAYSRKTYVLKIHGDNLKRLAQASRIRFQEYFLALARRAQ